MDRARCPLTVAMTLLLLGMSGALSAQETPPAVVPAAPAPPPPVYAVVNVVMHTTLGDIQIALEKDRAPITTANFLRYVDQKRFDNISFYRVVRLDEAGKYGLVQAGIRSDPKKVFPPIAFEAPAKTGLSHVEGAISMAHLAPGSARGDFFIMIGDLVSMDGDGTPQNPGYAVFGRVSMGMEVVRAIMDLPRDPNAGEGVMKGQMLVSPLKVLTVRRVP
jgi:peptidyl-prolyl cis-trans isomerase A (cyclophilin A)